MSHLPAIQKRPSSQSDGWDTPPPAPPPVHAPPYGIFPTQTPVLPPLVLQEPLAQPTDSSPIMPHGSPGFANFGFVQTPGF